MNNVIEVNHLVKSFGGLRAVDDISFTVKEGSLFGFLGVNGAGKTTTISILCTLTKKTEGSVTICGYDVDKEADLIRKRIGVLFQDNSLDNNLTVRDNLFLRGELYEKDRRVLKKSIEDTCENLEIAPLLNKKYKELSGGQKRLCDVARAILNKPHILFLDEPTAGMDPKTRQSLWKNIGKLQQENGMTIFLTTHYMEEAEKANDIVVMSKGKILATGTPYHLKEHYSNDRLKIECKDRQKVEQVLQAMNLKYYDFQNRINVDIPDTISSINILKALQGKIDSFEVVQGTVEDAFLNITGRQVAGGKRE